MPDHNPWQPEKIKQITVVDSLGISHDILLGNNGYRFYIKPVEDGEWEPCMEYKHDGALANSLANHLFKNA